MNENIEQDVTALIAEIIGKDISELKPNANFWNDLGVDSIKAIEIMVGIERRFKIRIREEQLPKISTISEAIQLVKNTLERK
jgi:acyl carrier protein